MVERGIAGPKVTGSIPVWSFFYLPGFWSALTPEFWVELGQLVKGDGIG